MEEMWYRFDDRATYAYETATGVEIYWTRHRVVRHTPQGVWLYADSRDRGGRWVSKTARKRWAYPTKEEALDSFRYRKRKQVAIYTARLDRAHAAYELALKLLVAVDEDPEAIENMSNKGLMHSFDTGTEFFNMKGVDVSA